MSFFTANAPVLFLWLFHLSDYTYVFSGEATYCLNDCQVGRIPGLTKGVKNDLGVSCHYNFIYIHT